MILNKIKTFLPSVTPKNLEKIKTESADFRPPKPAVYIKKPEEAVSPEIYRLRQIEEQLDLFFRISTLLTLGPSLKDVLRGLFEKISKKMRVSSLAIWLVDEKKEFFDLAAHHLYPPVFLEELKKSKLKSTEGGPGFAFRTKKPYLIKDIYTDPRTAKRFLEITKKEALPIRSIAFFPLMAKNETIGVFNFIFSQPRESLSRIEFIIFQTIANQIASFIQNSKIFQESQREKKELEDSRVALMNILEDIEEARGMVEEEKNKTLAIITNFADGLLVFDAKNRLFMFNPRAEALFGIKNQDVIKKSISELSSFPTLKSLTDLFEEETKGIYRKELNISERVVLEVSTVPVIREKEKLGTMVILHDITREKMIERMKTEFVSLSAHQLRTPLSAIKWTLRMILDGDVGEINNEQKDMLQKTYLSNERMITLVNDLLNVTRIEEGRYLFKLVLADIGEIAQSAVNSYQDEVKRKNIKLELSWPRKELPKLIVDVEKISLALQNLLDNAVRYTPKGGSIAVAISGGEEEIKISIKDTGVGIPAHQQERVFTKFFRAANVIKMETEGSGLGLFIAKNIIEAHGGKIWFESKEGEGTTFFFTLPVKVSKTDSF